MTSSRTDPSSGGCSTNVPATPEKDAVEGKRQQLVRESREASKEITELGEQLDGFSGRIRAFQDLHEPATDVLAEMPVNYLDERRLDGSIRQIQLLRAEVRRARESVEERETVVLSFATTTASTETSSLSAVWSGQIFGTPLRGYPETPARRRYLAAAEHPPLLRDAHELLVAFGLGTSFYGRSPADSLRDAERALMVGSHNAQATGGVLMNVRSAIDDTLAALIRRRPVQESAGKLPEKIESLGRQCGSPSVPPDVFERLAEQGANLKADLSQEGKQGDLPREVLIELFNRSVTWLAALLRVLDQSRMKT